MRVLITSVKQYLGDATKVEDLMQAKTVKGFFFQNLQLNVYDKEKIMPIIDSLLSAFLKELNPNLRMIFETDYVDKVYRDSYYSYFSTKLKEYGRNCIRISLVSKEKLKRSL